MRFSVANWRAISPFHHSIDDWINWCSQSSSIDSKLPQLPDLSFLPAMKRRRLSPLARLMFAAAWPLVGDTQNLPLVFVSHDGEVNRSLELWRSLLSEGDVSPASFALSVHNAIAGQWSLMRQDMSETVALCAHTNGLELAIVEACGLLAAGHEKVLVVVADEPLVKSDIKTQRTPFEYALALIVTPGDSWELLYQANDDTISRSFVSNNYYSSALTWIENQLDLQSSATSSWQVHTKAGYWQWSRGA